MHFMLIQTETPAYFAKRDRPAEHAAYWSAWGAYVSAIQASGIVVTGAALQPPAAATTLRVRDGQRLMHDGPHAASTEQLGGFYVIDVPDLDTALAWAARCPSAGYASVEVRPLMPPVPG
jgi:hypothetical protein